MEYKHILFEVADGVATITINRPKALNALNSEVIGELKDAAARCKTDEAIKAVILTGAGEKSFVAGADISQMAELRPQQAMEFMEAGIETFRMYEVLPKPVIAAVNGFALGGGCELALACHLRVFSRTAKIGLPEVGLGVIPGYGGTQRLARIVGLGRALELILTGNPIGAEEAWRIGLANRVVEPEELPAAARQLAAAITARAPRAVSLALEAVLAGHGLPLEQGLQVERSHFALAAATGDWREGVRAFLEKRRPEFRGR